MSELAWDPPGLAVGLAAVVAVAAWLVLARPDLSARGLLRVGAATLLFLGLFDIGCREVDERPPRLVVLVDRSLSMGVAGPDGISRAVTSAAWFDDPAFERWTEGWEVAVDSFGGSTTDVAGAIESAVSETPDAILVVSDGRAAAGRAAEPASVPLFVFAPAPVHVADLAVTDLAVESRTDGTRAVVDIAAVGGATWSGTRSVAVSVDGEVVGEREIDPPVAPGERRVVVVPLTAGVRGPRVVEARLEPADGVVANDRRARVWNAGDGVRGVLVVGLAPLWDFASFRRSIEASAEGPVDVFWGTEPNRLRPVAGGAVVGWDDLSAGRYRVAAVFGDPDRLGSRGAEWLERFMAAGGRGLLWGPQGYGGALPGLGLAVEEGVDRGRPETPEEGRAWLVRQGGATSRAPDGGEGWPLLERLPERPSALPEATPLLAVDDRTVAWVAERGTVRLTLLLGTGYYRWPLSGDEEAAFWEGWSGALARWLFAAEVAEGPLVRWPEGNRLSSLDERIARVIGFGSRARWRIQREPDGATAAEGELAAGDPGVIRAGPLEPGIYRLEVETGDRTVRERFVVEARVPDLAWTAADTSGLAAAARESGGVLLANDPTTPLPPATGRSGTTRATGPGTSPWTYLVAALLLLADWGLAERRRGRGPGEPATR